jgi:hypothetical protein
VVLSRGARDARPRSAHRARASAERATIALRKKSSGSGAFSAFDAFETGAAGLGSERTAAIDDERRAVALRLADATHSTLPFVCVPAKTCYAWRLVRRRSIAWSTVVTAAVLADTLTGCGRRATQLDCQLIVDKSVELELRETNQTSPDAIQKREEQVRGELQDEIKSCEGRRVTEQTMACVHSAATTQELDACLR